GWVYRQGGSCCGGPAMRYLTLLQHYVHRPYDRESKQCMDRAQPDERRAKEQEARKAEPELQGTVIKRGQDRESLPQIISGKYPCRDLIAARIQNADDQIVRVDCIHIQAW